MYLTDYRESSLKDVITQLEPGLFKKVTGLEVKDFELLCLNPENFLREEAKKYHQRDDRADDMLATQMELTI